METEIKWTLQLFAEGAADTGENAPAVSAGPAADAGQSDPQGALRWEQVKADPNINREIQAVVRARLKGARDAETTLASWKPAMDAMAKRYGLDPANPDGAAVAAAMAREAAQAARETEKQKLSDHIGRLIRQGDSLKEVFPGFDLRTALENPTFAMLTSPAVGLSVEDAYYALNRSAIQTASMQVAARKTAQQISRAIAAGQARPAENGTSGKAAAVLEFDYRSASPEQRSALKKRILQAAARGEKLFPGMQF